MDKCLNCEADGKTCFECNLMNQQILKNDVKIKTRNHYERAVADVSAFVLLDENRDYIGKIVFKHPKSGEGRLYCYLHVFGHEMVSAFASGYGYDKKATALYNASWKVERDTDVVKRIKEACKKGENGSWDYYLNENKIYVVQAL